MKVLILFVLTSSVLIWESIDAGPVKNGWKKIQFSPIKNIIGLPVQFSNKPAPPEGTDEFLEGLRLVMVTKDGYEYTGSLEEVENLFYTKEDKDDENEELPTHPHDKSQDEKMPSHPHDKSQDEKMPSHPHDKSQDEDVLTHANNDFRKVLEDSLEDLVAEKRSVIGSDSRRRQVPNRFPYTAIGRVAIGCTGTFIAPKTVLTAGHCVYGRSGWYSRLDVYRAKDCDPNQGTKHTWKVAVTLTAWINNRIPENDIGWIVVDTPSPVSMSFTFMTPPVTSTTIFIYGYPADLPTTSRPNWCLYGTKCPLAIVESKRLKYTCDTYGGNSGSGVYYNRCGVYTIIGVHAYGVY